MFFDRLAKPMRVLSYVSALYSPAQDAYDSLYMGWRNKALHFPGDMGSGF